MVAASVLAAALLTGVSAAIRPRVTVAREVATAHVTCGDPVSAVLTVTNRSRLRSARLHADEPVTGADSVGVAVPTVVPGTSRQVGYQVDTDRRGVLRLGPLRLHRSDPLGLWQRTFEVGDAVEVLVRPRVHAVQGAPDGTLRGLDGPARDSAPDGSISFHSLREYVPGDDRRTIHWRSSARTGTLQVRQHVDVALPRLTLLLDTATADHLDDAVEIAASLVVDCLTAGFETELVTTAGLTLIGSQPEDSGALLDALAVITPDGGLGPVEVADRIEARPGTTLVVVSGAPLRPEDPTALAGLARRHDRTVLIRVGVADIAVPGVDVIAGADARTALAAWQAWCLR